MVGSTTNQKNHVTWGVLSDHAKLPLAYTFHWPGLNRSFWPGDACGVLGSLLLLELPAANVSFSSGPVSYCKWIEMVLFRQYSCRCPLQNQTNNHLKGFVGWFKALFLSALHWWLQVSLPFKDVTVGQPTCRGATCQLVELRYVLAAVNNRPWQQPATRRRVAELPDLLEAASGRKPVHEKKHVAFQRLSFSTSVTIRRNFWMGIHMMHKIQSTSDTIQSKGDSIKIVILKIIRLLTHDTSLDKTCHLAIWAMRPEFDYSPMAKIWHLAPVPALEGWQWQTRRHGSSPDFFDPIGSMYSILTYIYHKRE